MEKQGVKGRKIQISNSEEVNGKGEEIMSEMLSGIDDLKFCVILEGNENQSINFKLVGYMPKIEDDIKKIGLGSIMSTAFQGILTQAAINNSGILQSANQLKTNQKNLIALLTQLPSKPVSLGDRWTINIKHDSDMFGNSNEKVKSENRVKFVNIKYWDNTTVAILDYDINITASSKSQSIFSNEDVEYVYSYYFNGKGEFDIDNGEWRKLEGILETKQKGFVSIEESEFIQLTKIEKLPGRVADLLEGKTSEEDLKAYQNLQKQIVDLEKKDSEGEIEGFGNKSIKENEVVNLKGTIDCPVVYSVQILASKNPLELSDKQFSKVSNDVYEIIKPGEVYMYKYRVGKLCSIEEAEKLNVQLNDIGFDGAFVVEEMSKN